MAETLKEMIKVMQHYEDGSVVQRCNFGSHNYSDITTEGHLFNFCDYKYRIKKEKVMIEKWLIEENDIKFVVETSDIDSWLKSFPTAQKLKLIESYEVEI